MIRTKSARYHGVSYVTAILFFGSVLYAFAIQVGFIFSEILSLTHFLLSILLLMVTLVYTYKNRFIGPLVIFFTIAYLIPFNHLAGYLIYGYDDIKTVWTLNPAIRPYLDDLQLVNLVGCIATSAVLGITAAICSSVFMEIKENRQLLTSTLSMRKYILLLAVSIFLAWASMPADSIVDAAYTQSQARFSWFNWPSAWLLSYVIVALLYSDCILDKSANAKLKWLYFKYTLFYLVVVNDLGNGKRTSLPLVFGLFMYHLTFVSTKKRIGYKKGFLMIGAAISIILLGNLHGAIRGDLWQVYSLNDLFAIFMDLSDRGVLGINMITHGTWTDVLMTPFSVAYMYLQNRELLYGLDYVNMILSLPPAFIADSLGYVRPWTSEQGPAWEMVFGNGGVHATVLPFRNFGLMGVAIVSYTSTLIVLYVEKFQGMKSSYFQPFLYVSIASFIPHWVWYGEKPLINGLIYLLLMTWTYKKLLTFQIKGIAKHRRPIY